MLCPNQSDQSSVAGNIHSALCFSTVGHVNNYNLIQSIP